MNAAALAFGIVYVRLPVRLDIEDRLQLRRTVQPVLSHGRLADNDLDIGEHAFDQIVGCARTEMGDKRRQASEFGGNVRREHHRLVARKGIEQDQGLFVDHFMPLEAIPVVMKRCRKAKTSVTGISATTVMAST